LIGFFGRILALFQPNVRINGNSLPETLTMRAFAAALAAVLLFIASPAHAKCPPLTTHQVTVLKQVEREQAAPQKALTAIDIASFTDFCRVKTKALLCAGGLGAKLTLAQVNAIDTVFRNEFEYRDDDVQYGSNVWNDAAVCGDCEDYALTLANRLHAGGEGGGYMALMIWSPFQGAGHATLIVDTADAGLVEVGTGPAATESARPFDVTRGARFAYIVMDGNRWITGAALIFS
jgi:predicted transglutaminase-like cysteine proteinase